jgi:hypothetical protein
MLALPLTKERRTHEWKTIQNIARNNNFPNKLISNVNQQIQRNTTHQKSDRKENINNTKWATFTYYTPKVRKITNLFKQTDIKIALKITIPYHKYLGQRPPTTLQSTTKVESTN